MYPIQGRHVSYQGQPSFTLGKAIMMRNNSTPQAQLVKMQAQVMSELSRANHPPPAPTHGGKGPKVEIVGPFRTQVHNLSSSDYESGSTDSSPEHHMSQPAALIASQRIVQIKPPGLSPMTPTRKGQGAKLHLPDSSPPTAEDYTDWVAYSAPIPELDEINVDSGDNSFESVGSQSTVSRASTPCTMIECALDAETESSSSATECEQELRIETKSKRLLLESTVDSPELTPSASPAPTLVPLPIPFSPKVKEEEVAPESPKAPPLFTCDACGGEHARMMLFQPCGDLACPSCFSSSLAAVSVTQSAAKCPCCLTEVSSFDAYNPKDCVSPRRTTHAPKVQQELEPVLWSAENSHKTIVMRIDNVAWDIEPHLVESWLPKNTLPIGHPCPVHICINRKDGRTKDYLYFEAASQDAARRVLQKCQNTFMPGGRVTSGRKRPVTVSQVSHSELLREVTPTTKTELNSLLDLCDAALSTPPPKLRVDSSGRGRLHASVGANGKVHYLKYRHAPFHSLMSVMCELRGDQESPAYWDLFHIASGAIAALASAIRVRLHHPDDHALLKQFVSLFHTCFGLVKQDPSAIVRPSRPRGSLARRGSPRK